MSVIVDTILMKRLALRFGIALAVVAIGVLAVSQQRPQPSAAPAPANPATFETMRLRTKLGSANFINAQGRVEFTFRGTVLIHDLQGTAKFSGNVIKQYDQNRRAVYYGRGSVVVEGRWANVYWWGGDFDATWRGQGIVRVDGEYYRDPASNSLLTGQLWYTDVPDDIIAWPGQATLDFPLPRFKPQAPSEPKRRTRDQ